MGSGGRSHLDELVKEYYSKLGVREWRRLVKDSYHRLEFDTTMYFLSKYLPDSGLVLDAGGGPGRYVVELAKKGYEVVLLDLTRRLLEIARRVVWRGVRGRVIGVVEGSIHDLSMFRDEVFDAVLCLGGALSHLVDEERRERAIDELIRVARRGAPIFISVIGRLALLVRGLIDFPDLIEDEEIFQRIRDTGDYYGERGFAPCHFYLPEELEQSLRRRGLQVLEAVGLEGLASTHRKAVNTLSRRKPEIWRKWWETHLKTCTHPAVVGISEHFLVVCVKE